MTQFPSGVISDLKKSFEFKLACSAFSYNLEGCETSDLAREKRTLYLVEYILLTTNLRNIKIESKAASG